MLSFTDLPLEVLEFEILPRVGVLYNYAIYNTSRLTRKALASKIKIDRRRNAQELAREGNLLSLLIRKVGTSRIILHNAAIGGHKDVLEFAYSIGAVADQTAVENACEGGFLEYANMFLLSMLNLPKMRLRVIIRKATRAGCRGGHKETIQWAKEKFSEYGFLDRLGTIDRNAFIGACEGGDLELLQSLEKFIRPGFSSLSKGFSNALSRGERRVVEWFYVTHPPQKYPNIYNTPEYDIFPYLDSFLLEEAIERTKEAGVSLIIKRNASRMFQSAISDGNMSLLQKLLARGFKLTPMNIKQALKSGNRDITMLAISKLEPADLVGPRRIMRSVIHYLPEFVSKNEELIITMLQRLSSIEGCLVKKDLNRSLYKAASNRLRRSRTLSGQGSMGHSPMSPKDSFNNPRSLGVLKPTVQRLKPLRRSRTLSGQGSMGHSPMSPKDSFNNPCSLGVLRNLVEALVSHGADINEALIGGCVAKDHSMVNFALSRGADNYKKALMSACAVGDLHTIKKMIVQLEKDDSVPTQVYKNALWKATCKGKKLCVEYIITQLT